MKYSEALQWKEVHMNLIGTIDEKGIVVSELVIVPTDTQNHEVFLRDYFMLKNKENAILPYLSGDVQIWAVDWNQLEKHNILFYSVVAT